MLTSDNAHTPASTERARSAADSLSQILSLPLPPTPDPALQLLLDPQVSAAVTGRLLLLSSGSSDDNLCRWLYDTFQSTVPSLQLAVLRFLPAIAAAYLPRALSRHPLAGFEAVLLALYAHETVARHGDPLIVNLPSLDNPSPYHEPNKSQAKNKSSSGSTDAEVETAVLSPVLDPHGTVRSTNRARIVGVIFELYYSKIADMPVSSKLEFMEFCSVWAGSGGSAAPEEWKDKGGRIPLPWELLQPIIRIVAHCLLGPDEKYELKQAAATAAMRLHERAMQDMEARAVLATRSLVRLGTVLAIDEVCESPGAAAVAQAMALAAEAPTSDEVEVEAA